MHSCFPGAPSDGFVPSEFHGPPVPHPEKQQLRKGWQKPTFRSPEILAPAKIPVADGKKMENKPKKEPSGPRQSGTKFWAKMSAEEEAEKRPHPPGAPTTSSSSNTAALDGGKPLPEHNPSSHRHS